MDSKAKAIQVSKYVLSDLMAAAATWVFFLLFQKRIHRKDSFCCG